MEVIVKNMCTEGFNPGELVISNYETIVLITKNCKSTFQGVCITGDQGTGQYSVDWDKFLFKPFQGEITLKS